MQSIGDYTAMNNTSTSAQITFADRKTAEKLYYSLTNKTIPGVEGKVEASWVRLPSAATSPAAASNGSPMKASNVVIEPDIEDGEIGEDSNGDALMTDNNAPEPQQQQMDYDVGGDEDWDIA